MEQAFLSSTFGLTPGTYWTDLAERDEGFRYSNGLAPTFTHWGQEEPSESPTRSQISFVSYLLGSHAG